MILIFQRNSLEISVYDQLMSGKNGKAPHKSDLRHQGSTKKAIAPSSIPPHAERNRVSGMPLVSQWLGLDHSNIKEWIGPEGAGRGKRAWWYVRLVSLVMIIGLSTFGKGWAQVSSGLCWPGLSKMFYFPGSETPFFPSLNKFVPICPGEGLKAGPVKLHPFLWAAEAYTDNVFRTNTGRESDFIHTIAPGIQAQLPLGGRHVLVFDYRAMQFFHQQTSGNDVLAQDASGQVVLDFPGGLKINLQGGHIEGFDPRGTDLDLQAPEITKWNTNSFRGQGVLSRPWGRIRLRVRSTQWNFENNNQAPKRDRMVSTANLTLFRSLTPKTSILVDLQVRKQNYDQNKQLDSFKYRVRTGLRWAATGKTTGEIQVGYEVLNFDRAPISQPAGSVLSSGGNGQEALSVSGNLTWRPTSRLTVNLRPFRRIRQAVVFDTSVSTKTGLGFSARQAIGTRMIVSGTLTFSHNEFSKDQNTGETTKRTDYLGGARIGVEYRTVRWLGLQIGYGFQKRSSTLDKFDYYVNTLMVGIQGKF